MIHVSSEFREQMEMRTDFKEQAEVTFLDGTKLSLTEDDFTVSNNSITDGAGSNGLPLGAAIQRQVQIELMNDDYHLEKYDFVGAQIRLYMTFWLPKTKELKERIEKIECGYFTVTKPETYGQTVIVAAVDDMYRADKAFYSDLIFPVSASELFIEMCEHCGIQPGNTLFRNNDFTIKEKPSGSDLTFRAVFGYLAMLAAGNARISRQGTLEILSYDFSVFDQEGVHIQELRNFNSLKIGTEDVVITGIRMKVKGKTAEEDQTFLCGKEGYLIEVENPLVAGQEQQLVDSIGQRLIGVHLRDFSGDHIAYPLAEFMDPVYVEDRKGRKYPSVLTDIDFTFFGITTLKNSAVSAIRNSSKFSSEASKTYEEARNLITNERKARDTAIKNLARKLESSSGLYCTKDEQPDGSTIYYMHDKAKLSESMIIWKMTAEAIGISTDGGKTYPTGLDATGTAILEKIYTIGLDATHIITGILNADIVKIKNLHLKDISDTAGTTLDATLDGITSEVSKKVGDTEIISKINQSAEQVSINADKIKFEGSTSFSSAIKSDSTVSGLSNSLSETQKSVSTLKQTAESISSEVSKKVGNNEVISRINQSAEKVSINADKIEFTGSAKFTSAVDANKKLTSASAAAANAASSAKSANDTIDSWSYNKDRTLINGGSIAANTVTAEKVAIGDFMNYATVTENDESTLLSDQAIVNNSTMGDWIEKSDKSTGLRYLFVSQLYCINSFEENDTLKMDFNAWCSANQIITYGIWFYDGSGTYKTGNWNKVSISKNGSFKTFSGEIKVPNLPINIKYYRIGFEFAKYGTTSRNCVQKVKVTKISGRLQVGDGFIDSKGSFRIGPMASINDDKDVEFKKAVFIDYGVEIFAGNDGTTPYMDFHREATNAATAGCDYTARVQNTADSWLDFYGRNQGTGTIPAACTLQAGQFRGTFAQASDQRLKKDIKTLDEGKTISMLMKYRPVRYRYINGVDTNVHHGLIAQEAQGIADWGLVDDRGEYLAINYIELIADLITVVQIHEKIIQKLLTERKEDDKGESDNSEVPAEL